MEESVWWATCQVIPTFWPITLLSTVSLLLKTFQRGKEEELEGLLAGPAPGKEGGITSDGG